MYTGKVTLRDAGGNTTTKSYVLNVSNASEAENAIQQIANALAGTTDAVIARVQYTSVVSEDDSFAPEGTQIEERASVTCSLNGKNQKYTMDIPAPKSQVFLASQGELANTVNILGNELQTYVSALVQFAFVSDGDTLANVLFGKRTHRASRRG